jgi:hypothetical protein
VPQRAPRREGGRRVAPGRHHRGGRGAGLSALRGKRRERGPEEEWGARGAGLGQPRNQCVVAKGAVGQEAAGKDLKVNGKEIDRRYDLKDGDIVEVGRLRLQSYVKE